jgi:hypothetical protein
MMMKKELEAWLSERIGSCMTDGGMTRIRAVALGGGPGPELCALGRFLSDFLKDNPDLGDPEDLVFSGTVVDMSEQWRTAVKSQGYHFVQQGYEAVVEAQDDGGLGAPNPEPRCARLRTRKMLCEMVKLNL